MTHKDLCTFLEWDSSFFDYRIGRINPDVLTEPTLQQVFQWVDDHKIDCLYFLADPTHELTIELARTNDFRLVDIRLTLFMELQNSGSGETGYAQESIRDACSEDIPRLKAIASTSHLATRFTFDTHFTDQQCQALYETWIENSCKGYADKVFVAEVGGSPVGYISCHTNDDKGQIGLLAVDQSARGQGLGQILIKSGVEWFRSRGFSEVSVVTQGHNTSAQRSYQRAGFLSQSLQLWYHRWSEGRTYT